MESGPVLVVMAVSGSGIVAAAVLSPLPVSGWQ